MNLHKKGTIILLVGLALTLILAVLIGITIESHICTPLRYANNQTSHICGQEGPGGVRSNNLVGPQDSMMILELEIPPVYTQYGGYFPSANQIAKQFNQQAVQNGWPDSIRNPAGIKPVDEPNTMQIGVGMCVDGGQQCQLIQVAIKYPNKILVPHLYAGIF